MGASEPESYEMVGVKLTPTSFGECRSNENELLSSSSTLRKLNPFNKNNRADLSGEKKYNDAFRSVFFLEYA